MKNSLIVRFLMLVCATGVFGSTTNILIAQSNVRQPNTNQKPKQKQQSPAKSQVTNGLQVTARAEEISKSGRVAIVLVVTIKNIGPKTRYYAEFKNQDRLGLDIRKPNAPFPQTWYIRHIASLRELDWDSQVKLRPNEKKRYKVALSRWIGSDMKGTYVVTAQVDSALTEISSNPVEIFVK